MPLLTTGAGKYAAAAAAAGSVWGDKGTTITLSTTAVTNDTAANTVSAFSSVRGTTAHSTGKYYFEVKVLAAPAVPNFIIGVMDNTTATGASMDDRLLFNSCGNLKFNGTQQANGWPGVDLGALFDLADGDVMGYAADFTNEFYYLSLNNTWFLSGDPTSGVSGTGNVGNGARPGARPMLSLWGDQGSGHSGLHQLITTDAAFTYTKPSGYTAWG